MTTKVNVRVGVGCFVISPDYPECVLLGERLGSHGANTFALPGGHLEMGEDWETCALREIKEETNLDLEPSSIRYVHVTNDVAISGNPDKHYITIFMEATVRADSAPLENMEPHKCSGWEFKSWNDLINMSPERVFDPLSNFIKQRGAPPYAVVPSK